LFSVFVEMKLNPKSIRNRGGERGGEDGEPSVLIFCAFATLSRTRREPRGVAVFRMMFEVVRSPWIILFLWRRATCSPSCCMIWNCFFLG